MTNLDDLDEVDRLNSQFLRQNNPFVDLDVHAPTEDYYLVGSAPGRS